jgi:hypothetical protein
MSHINSINIKIPNAMIIPQDINLRLNLKFIGVVGNRVLSSKTLVLVLPTLMSVMGTYKNINGIQKKEIILSFIEDVIHKSNLDTMSSYRLSFFMSSMAPDIIDMIFNVATKKNTIKKSNRCLSF